MALIELRRIFKEGIITVLILAALVIYVFNIDKETHHIAGSAGVMVFLLIYASFTGWAIFDRERQEGAVEYLLTLPVSRGRLLLIKFLPRLLCVLLLWLALLVLHNYFDFPIFFPFEIFSIYYASFFLVSLSLSISLKSFVGAFFLTGFLSFGLSLFIRNFFHEDSILTAALASNLVLLIFPIMFLILFFTFDLRPPKAFNLKFSIPPAVLLLVILVVGLLQSGHYWSNHFLTESGEVLRSSCHRTDLLRGDEVIPLKEGYMPLLESGGIIYAYTMNCENRNYFAKKLVTIDPATGFVKTLAKFEPGWFLGYGWDSRRGILSKGTYYNLLRNFEQRQYKIIMTRGKKLKELPVYGNFNEEYLLELLHVADSPRQYLVRTKKRIYSIGEKGEARELISIPNGIVTWKHRLLAMYSTKMILFDFQDTAAPPTPIFKREGEFKKVNKFHVIEKNTRKMLYRNFKTYFSFDLETMETVPVKIWKKPLYYRFTGEGPDTLHLLWDRGMTLVYVRYEGGEVAAKKKWPLAIQGHRHIDLFKTGVLEYRHDELFARYDVDFSHGEAPTAHHNPAAAKPGKTGK